MAIVRMTLPAIIQSRGEVRCRSVRSHPVHLAFLFFSLSIILLLVACSKQASIEDRAGESVFWIVVYAATVRSSGVALTCTFCQLRGAEWGVYSSATSKD
jgi:hypothetical protein